MQSDLGDACSFICPTRRAFARRAMGARYTQIRRLQHPGLMIGMDGRVSAAKTACGHSHHIIFYHLTM